MDSLSWTINPAAISATTTGTDPGEYLRALAVSRRRRLLRILDERETPVPTARLARLVAAREAGTSADRVSDDERNRVRISLHHVHLPTLEDAGLIERDEEAETVDVADDPLWDDPALQPFLDPDPGTDPSVIDDVLRTLASEQRRTILAILERRERVSMAELADEFAAATTDGPVSDQRRARFLADLKHVQLPKLVDLGIVEFDADGRWVVYEGNGFLDEWWRHRRDE